MGYKISWIAAAGLSKSALLDTLGFMDSDNDDEANESPLSAADLGNGWSLVWSNDFTWSEHQSLVVMPADCRLVVMQLHEGIMYASARGALGDMIEWQVTHDAQEGIDHLDVSGAPPAELDSVRDSLFAEQAADDSGSVDYAFDIPVELAARITGFRHNQWEMPAGLRPRFTAITMKK